MKKTMFAAIAFAVATVPMTFAAQTTPANPPASGAKSTSAPAVTTTKKHTKHAAKKAAPKKTTGATPSTPAVGK
ncbi:MAG TPA: hypothetical protein VG456_04870 [Candidatus Sulfopaludibacter sp.]|jgi:hypothetical protein|nr:hypothetical protein [Candidatus Sulfopaludibacter sp.]